MRERLAETLHVPPESVSVKAKTGEGDGRGGPRRGGCGARGGDADTAMRIFGVKPAMEALRAGRVTALTVSARRQRGLDGAAGAGGQSAGTSAVGGTRRAGPAGRRCGASGCRRHGAGARRLLGRRSARGPHPAARRRPRRHRGPAQSRGHRPAPWMRRAARGSSVPERRAAPLTGSAVKASAGALVHVPVARVVNLVRGSRRAEGGRGLDDRPRRRGGYVAVRPRPAPAVRFRGRPRRVRASTGWRANGATGVSRCRCGGG